MKGVYSKSGGADNAVIQLRNKNNNSIKSISMRKKRD
jgi:hypothetical protein